MATDRLAHAAGAEMPRISAAMYGSSSAGSSPLAGFDVASSLMAQAALNRTVAPGTLEAAAMLAAAFPATSMKDRLKPPPAKQENLAMTDQRRLVQVFIADPDPNVPLEHALLHQGAPQMTDLSDQELFFDIEIKALLDKHNALRATLTNKSVKSKDVMLEPARVRDLRMTVVTIAAF